ncbi:MAG: HDOD domain-containing protein [Pseudomonadota bacterium]
MSGNPVHKLGRYELRRELGRGSQGCVYMARDPELDRDVAIKLLTSDKAEFRLKGHNGAPLEALTASKIEHPHIIPIHDIGESAAGPYLVFGFVNGRTLAMELSSRGHYKLTEALPLMAQILDAVATAHERGVLHLDLGPRNILIDSTGKAQIMDFGLAQFVNFKREDLGLATGTLRYMAPEHFLRRQLGPQTDVFALASTFYEMLAGRRAIPGENIDAIQRNIVDVAVDFAPIADLQAGEHVTRFLRGAFVSDMDERYADARMMRDAFRKFVTAAGLGDTIKAEASSHSTVSFLVRRMQHKKDFPAISSTLTEINRLTGDNASASADTLANVILRDMSLTRKLLTMANSSFYGARASEVASVSQAVVLLGVQQVRMVASSLTLFGHLRGDSMTLRDSMTRSFMAGLIARHLGQRAKLRGAEEAFIAGLCQNLGENLAIYYFSEEHEVARERIAAGASRQEAAREVLGVAFSELGAATAEIWSLPQVIITAIGGVPDGEVPAPADEEEAIRNFCVLANELCASFHGCDGAELTERLETLCGRFVANTGLNAEFLFRLFEAAYEKLKQFAPIFEINVAESVFCKSVEAWLAHRRSVAETDPAAAATG